jgi:ABC-2 type transport system ATP-binding protein
MKHAEKHYGSKTEMNSEPIVQTSELTKNYGHVPALVNCSVSIPQGEVFGLLGPNGSGKTTFLRLLMGFLRPSRGRATIAGHDCYRESVAVHAGVSYLPGDARLSRGMKGRDLLAFFASFRNEGGQLRSLRIADRLGLELSRRVAQLSTGMRQKLALATVLAPDVPLLILDEPTSNLDPTVRGRVLAMIREARAAGRTVVFSSHVLPEVEQVCDRVVILRRGELVHDQLMSGIRRRHRIRCRLAGALPAVPDNLASELSISPCTDGRILIDAPGDLAPVLGWLATQPLADVHIEPIGLQAIYETYHPVNDAASAEVAA